MTDQTPITASGALPKKIEYSNIDDLRAELVKDPAKLRYAVIAFDVVSTKTVTDTGETTPAIRIRRLEAPTDAGDVKELQGLLERVNEERVGALPLNEPEGEADPDD